MVERNTESKHSVIFLKDSEVTRILWAGRSRETRDSCLASLPLHALRVWAKTRHLTSDTIQEVQWLMISAIWTYLFTWWRFVYKSMNWCQSYLERNVFERKKHTKQNKSCLQHKACPRIKTESPNAYYDTLMHKFECSQKSSDNLPTPTPHPSLTNEPFCFHSGKHGDRFLITVLVDPKIKIPAWYCFDKAVMLFDSYFTFESKPGWHSLFLTVESTRGIWTLAVVFELLEEMVARGCRNGKFKAQFHLNWK